MKSKVRRGRHRLPRRRLGAGLLAAAVLAIGGGVTVVALGSDPAPAHADALCDQMRAQYGSNWPCISVPTNTFQPTTNTPAPTTGANGAGSGGPQVGSNIGPGPGEGNGTPIVTVPGQAAPQPPAGGDGNGGPGPTNPNTGGVRPTAPQPVPPGENPGQIPVVPSTAAPAVSTVPGAVTENPEPGTPPHALDSGSKQPDIPLAAWVVAGAAAFAAANPRVRASLRSRVGSNSAPVIPRAPYVEEAAKNLDPGPIGPGAPPPPGDPKRHHYDKLSDYRKIFWDAYHESPIGKEIHHAIEQYIFNHYPGVFDEAERNLWTNLRGIWQSMAPKLHQSAIRRAWDAIYDVLEELGIIPAEHQPMTGEPAEVLREQLIYWAFVVDLLFGEFFEPSASVVDSPEFEEFLRSLGLSEDEIAAFHGLTYEERLELLDRLLDGYDGNIPELISSLDSDGANRLAAPRSSVPSLTSTSDSSDPGEAPSSYGQSPTQPSYDGGSTDDGASSSAGAEGSASSGGDSGSSTGDSGSQSPSSQTDQDVRQIGQALQDMKQAQQSGDGQAYGAAQQRLNQAGNQFQQDNPQAGSGSSSTTSASPAPSQSMGGTPASQLPSPPLGYHWGPQVCTPDNPNGGRVAQPDGPDSPALAPGQVREIPDPVTPNGPQGSTQTVPGYNPNCP